MSRWFRMYDELLDDPKVQRLSPPDFKGWVNLLCLSSRNGGKLPHLTDIAFALRETLDAVSTLVERLRSAGLIERRSGGADGAYDAPYKWNERQYKSDTSTDRVKRFRQRSKKQDGNAVGTPPDTETEADIPLDKSNGAKVDVEAEFWANAKGYLKRYTKSDPGSLIAKWLREQGKETTVAAINAAQLERAVDPREYIPGYFRRHGKAQTYDRDRITV